MRTRSRAIVRALWLLVLTGTVIAQSPAGLGTTVGEIRTLAASVDEVTAVKLRRSGWAEAEGQVVSQREFPELFVVIGRLWTSPRVDAGQFQLPNLRWRDRDDIAAALRSGLTCSDLVTGGKTLAPTPHLVAWIHVGRDARSLAPVRRTHLSC